MFTIPNYQISAQIYESANSIIYSANRIEDNKPVILKFLKQDYPTPEELLRYRQEYEMIGRLADIEGVINAYELFNHQNQLVICLEDFQAKSLKHWLAERSFSFDELLQLAILSADILGKIHQHTIIHKDINPANLIFNPSSGRLKIIDFGISSILPRENPTLKNPNQLEGTLAYISPEQTGRMNRALDYRSDFYSLGVTFYELFTGTVPFETTDAMELVHSHIAIKPPSPIEINPELPTSISNIIMKLLEKTAEARYQNAWGLKADLQKCQAGEALVTLGQQDFSDQFQLPQKLYGRESEIEALLSAFERLTTSSATKGKAEIILVAGYSGVGKSALVQEIYKPITQKRGYFIAGKFDQFQRNIPYSAIVGAFTDLVRQLLTESEAQLAKWQQQILSAVGHNGQVIIDVIPEVELIIGTQPPVQTLNPTETQNRFNLVFQHFFRAICQPDHPLVLFIDDLQWADLASLNLLKTLSMDTETQDFLIIGAYRNNEVEATHPLMMTLQELTEAQVAVNTIHLQNLSVHDVNRLIAETLGSDDAYTHALANLVYEKTRGNAFFTKEFLKSLYVKQLLTFDWQKKQWQWDVESILAQKMTDNVVVLMAESIGQLSEETQAVLKLAACIGNRFELKTLSIICQQSPAETLTVMLLAIKEGLIIPLDNRYKSLEIIASANVTIDFKFLHDRVQQAAYSLMTTAQNQALHLQIGRLLLASTDNLEENLFEIVNQLNKGKALIDSEAERLNLAQLNLKAGQKAKAATAYQPAFNYLKIGIELLDHQAWQQQYSFTLQVHTEMTEVAYLNGDFDQMEKWGQLVLSQANTVLEQVAIYEVQIQADIAQNNPLKALQTAFRALSLLGLVFPKKPDEHDVQQALTETREHLSDYSIETLCDLPMMAAPEKLATMRILSSVVTAALTAKPVFYPLLVCKMVNLSIKQGNAQESISGYAFYGFILCRIDETETGFKYGKLALTLLERFKATALTAKALEIFEFAIRPWTEHLNHSLKPCVKAYQVGLETGDIIYATYGACVYCMHSYFLGKELTQLESEMSNYHDAFVQLKQNMVQHWHDAGYQSILNLIGQTKESENLPSYHLVGKVYDERTMLPFHQQCHDHVGLYFFYVYRLILCCLFQAYPQAIEMALKAEQYLETGRGTLFFALFHFYDSLAQLGLYSKSQPQEQKTFLEKVAANQTKMKKWAERAPMNYLHKYYLVEAERCRVLGFDGEAREYYDQAIELAHENKYINEEALAYELAGQFYFQKGKTKFAQLCLREAHYAYQLWGALAKVADLAQKYPQFLAKKTGKSRKSVQTTTTTIPDSTLMASNSSTTDSNWLDLSSVLKASQTLSGEIVLSNLLTKMMQIVIENAGAEKGFLILPDKEQWVIEAESDVNSQRMNVLQSIPLEKHQQIAVTLIHYVARTQEKVVLDNASVEGQFHRDPYIIESRPKSVLCVPLINQGRLAGILYLENNLTEGAFTPDRLEVLQVLSSQIAISIENALLYRTLEQKVEERTVQLADANQQIMALNEQLKSENLRMSAELDVSRKLQQMLLPPAEEISQIKELDIAGFMEPADEVGGDYYDVLQHNGRILFGIGDVTGHGLESGALAIMVQASVRTLLADNETDPVKFLSALNQMVYRNVERMKIGKNLTLALVDYLDKQLYLSGQHEEIIVVRQGELELIDTFDLGFPLGLDKEITTFVNQISVSLNCGDVVVLYTDGITEAENIEGELYGLERLCEVIQQNWQHTAQQLQQIVVDDVRQFIGEQTVFDDITLLILKQK